MASAFEQWLREEMQRVEDDVAAHTVETVTDLVANLRERSPVDTGHMRANWIPSVGDPAVEVQNGSRDTQYNRGMREVLNYKLDQGDVFISNNVPYTPIVNVVHPTEAGFIESSINDAEIAARNRSNS